MAPLTKYVRSAYCTKGTHSVSMSACVKTGARLATLGLEVR